MALEMIEINEAIDAGEDVLNISEKVLQSLDSAKLWGVFDMFSDHSLLSGIFKHSKLDDAQDCLEELKIALNRFNSELNDVKVYNSVSQINFDGFVKIFDILFDNFFVDIYALTKISDSKRQIQSLIDEVKNVLRQLRAVKC